MTETSARSGDPIDGRNLDRTRTALTVLSARWLPAAEWEAVSCHLERLGSALEVGDGDAMRRCLAALESVAAEPRSVQPIQAPLEGAVAELLPEPPFVFRNRTQLLGDVAARLAAPDEAEPTASS
jgi:hypothetical protein